MRVIVFFGALLLAVNSFGTAKGGPEFNWKEVSGAKSYQLEISKTTDFSKIVLTKTTGDHSYKWADATPGIFYWRVRAVDEKGRLGELSSPGLLEVTVPPPTISEKYRKIDVRQIKLNEIPVETVVLHWNPSIHAKSYEVEYASQPSFSDSQILATNKTEIKKEFPASKPILWRVRPLGESGESISEFSEVGLIQFQTQFIKTYNFLKADAYVEPQADDLLLINGKRYYLEDVQVKVLGDRKEDSLLSIKVFGNLPWNKEELIATSRCFGAKIYDNLTTTGFDDTWIFKNDKCADKKLQLCLSQADGKQVCSAWLDSHFKKLPTPEKKAVAKLSPFSWKGPVAIYWTASDGRSMQIVWDQSLALKAKGLKDESYPSWFFGGLVSGVRVETLDANSNLQNNLLISGSLQGVYWPDSSPDGDLSFTKQRIGGQLRYTQSLPGPTLSNGQPLTVSWADLSINYRREPSNIFEGDHVYGILTGSNYVAAGLTTTRAGGGIGGSFHLPDSILGLKYSGKAYLYLDGTIQPLDLSGDGQGPIFDSRLNGVWLVNNHWFLTGEIEMRLLNLAMENVNSVFRVQIGGGYAF